MNQTTLLPEGSSREMATLTFAKPAYKPQYTLEQMEANLITINNNVKLVYTVLMNVLTRVGQLDGTLGSVKEYLDMEKELMPVLIRKKDDLVTPCSIEVERIPLDSDGNPICHIPGIKINKNLARDPGVLRSDSDGNSGVQNHPSPKTYGKSNKKKRKADSIPPVMSEEDVVQINQIVEESVEFMPEDDAYMQPAPLDADPLQGVPQEQEFKIMDVVGQPNMDTDETSSNPIEIIEEESTNIPQPSPTVAVTAKPTTPAPKRITLGTIQLPQLSNQLPLNTLQSAPAAQNMITYQLPVLNSPLSTAGTTLRLAAPSMPATNQIQLVMPSGTTLLNTPIATPPGLQRLKLANKTSVTGNGTPKQKIVLSTSNTQPPTKIVKLMTNSPAPVPKIVAQPPPTPTSSAPVIVSTPPPVTPVVRATPPVKATPPAKAPPPVVAETPSPPPEFNPWADFRVTDVANFKDKNKVLRDDPALKKKLIEMFQAGKQNKPKSFSKWFSDEFLDSVVWKANSSLQNQFCETIISQALETAWKDIGFSVGDFVRLQIYNAKTRVLKRRKLTPTDKASEEDSRKRWLAIMNSNKKKKK